MATDPARYSELLRPHFAGRKILLIGGHVAQLTHLARLLRGLGAQPPLMIAVGMGVGEMPSPDEATWHLLETPGTEATQIIRNYEHALRNLPADARAAVERYDPEGKAIALGFILLSLVREVAGRPVFGARHPSWIALEDKVAIDAFWDRARVDRAPSRVVDAHPVACMRAAAELDRGEGTVWAGDAREGPHGAGTYTRWVRRASDGDRMLAQLTHDCDRIRVMPFLEGIPCSIHGIVFAHDEVAFRPVELLILRRAGRGHLVYAGASTYWDPPAADREVMRRVARRTARALRDEVGFRGPFTVDGVLSTDGFLPTELNPRVGLGHLLLDQSLEGVPMTLFGVAAREDETLGEHAAALEQLVIAGADSRRQAAARVLVPGVGRARTGTFVVTREGDDLWLGGAAASGIGRLEVGATANATFVSFVPNSLPTGRSLAPLLVEVFALADRELGTEIGPLEPAVAVR